MALALAALVLAASPGFADTFSNRLTDPRAHAGEIAGERDTDAYVGTRGWRSSTFMVGDSLTRIGLLGGFRPLGLAQGWEVSSVSGRDVSTLPYYLRDRVQAQHPHTVVKRLKRRGKHRRGRRYRLVRMVQYRYPVKKAVIALGTNATQGWSYEDLRSAVNLLPSTTAVVFVTPYRDPVAWPESGSYRVRASVGRTYAAWESRISQLRAHTCVADWRGFVQRYPQVLHDGVHPTSAGARSWARLVAGAVAACR